MKKFVLLSLVLLLFTIILTGCGVFQEVEAPSATLEAVPLELGVEATGEPPVASQADDSEPIAEAAPDDEPEAEPTAVEDEAVNSSPIIYSIVPGQSTVRFELDEDLRGERITVVGMTDQIVGELGIDLADLAATQVGEIRINARTLATDNNFRNRAINNEILETGAYEFISFVPTAVTGLPDSANVGDTLEFTITGDLTIRNSTNPVTFAVTATAVTEDQLSGTASTTVMRGDYGLRIPSVPNVANVEEEVELYIDFVANAK